jgi:CubicO group peptidase (beta-lactamase class C family)
MKYVSSLLLFSVLYFGASGQQKDNRLAGLDTMIIRILKEWKVPGASIAIVEKNKVVLTKGYGFKDLEAKKPVSETTQFAIGSCTKAFTAALIGNAIREKGIELDAPVSSYFPELKFMDNSLTASVTLRDMLSHRTGLPRHDLSWYSGTGSTREQLVHNIRYLEASAPLRQRFQYNNYMYMAIGSFLEKQYGKSWEELIEEKFFSTLAMKNSTTGIMGKEGDFSFGYVYKNDTIQRVEFLTTSMKAVAPCGGIVSTARDMANWLLMWTNQGQFNGKEIIAPNYYQEAISSQMIAAPNLPTKNMSDYYLFNYGLGWYVASYRGRYGVGHGGNINGFSSFISFLPTDSMGVYIAVNQNNSHVPRILSNLIMDRMIGVSFRDWNGIFKQAVSKRDAIETMNTEIIKASHPLSTYSGRYSNKGYGTISIQADKAALTGTFNRWKLKIQHLNYNHFRFTTDEVIFDGSEALNGEFKIAADGTISSLAVAFEEGIQDIEFRKELVPVTIPKGDLKKYEGEYTLSGLVFKIYTDERGKLKAIVPGQPEYELEPAKEHIFTLKGLTGFSARFELDEKGAVRFCHLIQPNGTYKLTKVVK